MNNQTITLILTPDQYNVIVAGLGELPMKVSAAVYGLVQKQVEEQIAAAQAPADAE